MYILGINSVYHESAACLLRDGELVALAEEERFNRIKHGKKPSLSSAAELPLQAIRYCLHQAGIPMEEVDLAGYSSDPTRKILFCGHGEWDSFQQTFLENVRRSPQVLAGLGFKGTFTWVDHHTAHAASAYYPSGFAEAAVLTIDGIGDDNTTASFHGVGNRLELVQDVKAPHSIGFLWELVSLFLGFDIYDACKVMGLAAYGKPQRYADHFRRLVRLLPGGKFVTQDDLLRFWMLDYLTPSGYFRGLEDLFGIPKRGPGEGLQQTHCDIAAALQQATEEVVLHLARHLHEETGAEALCLAGGVALNCVSNTRVFEEGPFRRLFVQPVAHDAGTALGAALLLWHQLLGNGNRRPMTHTYWGPAYSAGEIEEALQDRHLKYTRPREVEQTVAGLLAEGRIVAWFQGRMEAGPRALGNRSLLADPRRWDMRDVLNHKVKHREYFRPFAPSVLHEEAGKWWRLGKETAAAEHMLMAYPVLEHQRARVPAIVHVDGTSRIQCVRRETNPRYHRLISDFHRLTGVPMVLNTSFNDAEPIVCSPEDAICTFLQTEIDYLVLEDFLVSKADSSVTLERERGRYVQAAHARRPGQGVHSASAPLGH